MPGHIRPETALGAAPPVALVQAVSAWARENSALFEAVARGRHEANKQAVRDEIARLEDETRQRRDELARLESRAS